LTAATQLTLGLSLAWLLTNARNSLFSASMASWYVLAPADVAIGAPFVVLDVDAAGVALGAADEALVRPAKPANGLALGAPGWLAVSPWNPPNGFAPAADTLGAAGAGAGAAGLAGGRPPTRALTILRCLMDVSEARSNPTENESAVTPP
jgi:hypothetical protein